MYLHLIGIELNYFTSLLLSLKHWKNNNVRKDMDDVVCIVAAD